MRRLLPSLSICLLLAACSSPTPPAHQDQPQPQAAPESAAAPQADTTSPITATANGYKDAARNAAAQTEDAAAQEKAQLDQAAQ